MDAAEKLLAIEEIHQLKARYFRFVDTKDWAGFRTLFADDVDIDITEDVPDGRYATAEAFVAFTEAGTRGCESVHHGHCPEIELTSPTTARGIWAMEDMLRWQGDADRPAMRLHGMGHYHETYARIDGRWVIATMTLRRLQRNVTTGDA